MRAGLLMIAGRRGRKLMVVDEAEEADEEEDSGDGERWGWHGVR